MIKPGRIVIYTDVPEVTSDNIIDVLREAIKDHDINAARIDFLLDYDAGIQPLQREKLIRAEINCECQDNVANEVVEFNLGFKWGNPITFVQNGEDGDEYLSKAISALNKCYDMAEIEAKTQELGRYVEIGGIGYVLVDVNTEWEDGESPFTVDVLDPRMSFVVRSTYYPDKRIVLGVSFRKEKKTGRKLYTCFTKEQRFEIVNLEGATWKEVERSGEMNPLHMIPIVEYIRSFDRMGCFERQISEMDNLNLLISDFTNDVDQNTQAIWHGNDVEFPTIEVTDNDGNKSEVVKKPESGEWVLTYTNEGTGKQPFINPLTIQYDYEGMLNNIQVRRQTILQKCNVPNRSEASGGSTGIAMSDATGWSHAEAAASKQEMITSSNKMKELAVVLAAIKNSSNVPQDDPLRKLSAKDLKPSIKRQKTYELSTKINAFATGVSHGIAPRHMITAIHLFDDDNQVIEDSKPYMDRYLSSIYDKSASTTGEESEPNADRNDQDLSDQIENSPMIDKSRTDK